MTAELLQREFYCAPTIEVARELLGCVLEYEGLGGRIVEVEAYLGEDDEAAHSFRGVTPRTRVIFGPPGHAYVYLNYGIHACLNVVAEPEGRAGCVLIRAVEGIGNGPGKLTRALGITCDLNGCDLTRGPLTIRRGLRPTVIVATRRIGIRKSADLPLRFLAGD
jgi:DNA-3-methyladenine glycosylase